jgi:lipopolysaccharide transport system ATP-binding protein
MSDIAIRVENLGKRYRIGKQERYQTLRDTLTDTVTAPLRWLRHGRSANGNGTPDHIWALKDVSFEIPRGEVVGIIGRNGAGKSTLLKVLSRITEPTEGRAKIHGRVGSLLEVGTGFHPELTGRENIYLNGAILGMKRAELQRRFDEIVAFAEVEKFIDTPVKHYSSGMHVRLAFAVAAHLEPEILIVDEVLAVGDQQFQRKCLGKLESVAHGGRTVALVSHNMAAIQSLCSSAVLLDGGTVRMAGRTSDVLSVYQDSWGGPVSPDEVGVLYSAEREHSSAFQVLRIEMLDAAGNPKPELRTWDYVRIRVHYGSTEELPNISVVLRISSRDGVPLLLTSTQPDHDVALSVKPGSHFIDCEFPSWPFSGGQFAIASALAIPMKEWLTPLQDLAIVFVQGANVFRSKWVVPNAGRSALAIRHSWILPSEPLVAPPNATFS